MSKPTSLPEVGSIAPLSHSKDKQGRTQKREGLLNVSKDDFVIIDGLRCAALCACPLAARAVRCAGAPAEGKLYGVLFSSGLSSLTGSTSSPTSSSGGAAGGCWTTFARSSPPSRASTTTGPSRPGACASRVSWSARITF